MNSSFFLPKSSIFVARNAKRAGVDEYAPIKRRTGIFLLLVERIIIYLLYLCKVNPFYNSWIKRSTIY